MVYVHPSCHMMLWYRLGLVNSGKFCVAHITLLSADKKVELVRSSGKERNVFCSFLLFCLHAKKEFEFKIPLRSKLLKYLV